MDWDGADVEAFPGCRKFYGTVPGLPTALHWPHGGELAVTLTGRVEVRDPNVLAVCTGAGATHVSGLSFLICETGRSRAAGIRAGQSQGHRLPLSGVAWGLEGLCGRLWGQEGPGMQRNHPGLGIPRITQHRARVAVFEHLVSRNAREM